MLLSLFFRLFCRENDLVMSMSIQRTLYDQNITRSFKLFSFLIVKKLKQHVILAFDRKCPLLFCYLTYCLLMLMPTGLLLHITTVTHYNTSVIHCKTTLPPLHITTVTHFPPHSSLWPLHPYRSPFRGNQSSYQSGIVK